MTKRMRKMKSNDSAYACTSDTWAFTTHLYPLCHYKEMSGRKDKRDKRKRRPEPPSSSSSSSTSSSSIQAEDVKYIADYAAFMHSVGMSGTSNERSIDPKPKKAEKKPRDKKDKTATRKTQTTTAPTPTPPPKTKSGIPLPMSTVHLPNGRNSGVLSSPDPPSVTK